MATRIGYGVWIALPSKVGGVYLRCPQLNAGRRVLAHADEQTLNSRRINVPRRIGAGDVILGEHIALRSRFGIEQGRAGDSVKSYRAELLVCARIIVVAAN